MMRFSLFRWFLVHHERSQRLLHESLFISCYDIPFPAGHLHRKMLNYPQAVDDFLVAVEKAQKGKL